MSAATSSATGDVSTTARQSVLRIQSTNSTQDGAEAMVANRTTKEELDRLHHENERLVERLSQLRVGLERLVAANAELRRSLTEVRLENRSRRAHGNRRTDRDRSEHVRSLLRDRASRNP